MPNTTLNWKTPTRRPRNLAGAISAIYIGPNTDEPPIPSPPRKRNPTRDGQLQAAAQPNPEIKYKSPMTRRLSRRPIQSPGDPARGDPITVPQTTLATVIPNNFGESRSFCVRAAVVLEITAESNPTKRPPR